VSRAPRLLIALLSLAASLSCVAPAVAESGASSSALPELPELNVAKPENPFYRFEIVSLGSYPITLFYVGFAFDLERYYANDFSSSYIPLVSSSSLTDSDRWARLGAALGVSFLVGAIDAIIHDSKVKAAKRLHAASLEASANASAARAAAEPAASSP
jgi:hypothetical protein